MDVDNIVQRILAKHPDLGREKLMDMIEAEENKYHPFLSRETAASIVASKLGVEMEVRHPLRTDLRLADLGPKMYDVSIVGRLLTLHPIQNFQKENGENGKLRRGLLADGTGIVPLVLWNDKAVSIDPSELVERAVMVHHGYTRSSPNGRTELHVGERGSISPAPSGIEGLPKLSDFSRKLHYLRDGEPFVNIIGMLTRVCEAKDLSSGGRILEGRISDDTGSSAIIFWGDRSREAEGLKPSDIIRITGASSRKGFRGVEVHVDRGSMAEVLPDHPPIATPRLKIAMLRDGMSSVDVLVKVASATETALRDGIKRVRMVVNDDSGALLLVLWGEKAELASSVRKGDALLVVDGYVKTNRRGALVLVVGRQGEIVTNTGESVPDMPLTQTKNLKKGYFVSIEGSLSNLLESKMVDTGTGETVSTVTVLIKDASGEVAVTLWHDLADVVRHFTIGDRMQLNNLFVSEEGWLPKIESTRFTEIFLL